MKIPPPTRPSPSTGPAPAPSRGVPGNVAQSLLAQLPLGRELKGMVSADGGGGDGTVKLNIGGKVLEITTPLQLMAGMALKLKVEKTDGGQLLLRLLEPPQAPELQQALRRELPRQADLKPLFEALSILSEIPLAEGKTQSQTQTQTGSLAQQLRSAAQQLMQSLPTARQLGDGEGLKQAVRDSGMFLEQKLAQGNGKGLERDLKGQLLRLLAQLNRVSLSPPPTQARQAPPQAQAQGSSTPTPLPPQIQAALQNVLQAVQQGKGPSPQQAQPQAPSPAAGGEFLGLLQGLFKQGESALARVQVNQMQSLPQGEADSPEWLLELPVRHQHSQLETLKLRIRREQGGGGEQGKEERWNLSLEMDDGMGGPLRVGLRLSREQVSVDFWAESESVSLALRDKLGELDTRLRSRGLEVQRLNSHHGSPEEEPPPRPRGLLREEA